MVQTRANDVAANKNGAPLLPTTFVADMSRLTLRSETTAVPIALNAGRRALPLLSLR